ncbi:MAG: hypothetical protein KAJ43_08175 [Gemmatimonadetes bacterium]|nr:hypothetical protein [Gemmatimonadota bacterium]
MIGTVGCAGESQSAAEWDGTMRDSAGILIVENNDVPLWGEEDRWTFSEVLRIGTLEGDPEYQFGRISGFVPLSDGRIAVTDNMAHNLRFFSPEGVHERTVGTTGSGPKDFGSRRLNLLRGPGDTLLVMDWANLQTHRFTPDGEWLESWRIAPEGGLRVWGWDTAPSGLIINLLTPVQTPDIAASDTLDAVVVRGVRGHILDTLMWLPSARSFSMRGGLRLYSGGPVFDLRWDGGLVTGRSDRYRFEWYDANGDLERIVSLRRDKIPFDDREQAACMDLLESVWKRWDVSPTQMALWKSTTHFEEFYPAFRSFMNGPRGTLWVQQVRPTSDLTPEEVASESGVYPWPYGSTDWDVFDREGRYLGVVEKPPNIQGFQFFGDKLYGVWEDDFDVQYLIVMQIDGLPTVEEG